MTDREIMQQALDALKLHLLHHEHGCVYLNPVMYALEAALAQPEQEELIQFKDGKWSYVRKPWVGLTVNEARDFFESKLTRSELITEISEFLEEKNGG